MRVVVIEFRHSFIDYNYLSLNRQLQLPWLPKLLQLQKYDNYIRSKYPSIAFNVNVLTQHALAKCQNLFGAACGQLSVLSLPVL